MGRPVKLTKAEGRRLYASLLEGEILFVLGLPYGWASQGKSASMITEEMVGRGVLMDPPSVQAVGRALKRLKAAGKVRRSVQAAGINFWKLAEEPVHPAELHAERPIERGPDRALAFIRFRTRDWGNFPRSRSGDPPGRRRGPF